MGTAMMCQRCPKKEGVQKRRLGRNPRIPFSTHQIALLEHKFRHKQYLSSYDVTELASLLCLSQTRVKIWFQNRRARERRDHESRCRTELPSTLSAFRPVVAAAASPAELPPPDADRHEGSAAAAERLQP
ncbi:homeobox protein H17-like [Pollicipes pollicipes]|uniref:homeobox protein H17-like n=1 Tax=Pollicipes pollicipes TaxID=41117 RepID=UPI0018849712|nr:homeobox protein H17-like [Pollicipes pollicipes]